MFEKLSVRSTGDPHSPLDLGALVEAAVFYGHVDLLIDPTNVRQIIRTWSADGFIALLDSGLFTLRYFENMSGIRTQNTGTAQERYDVVVFQLADSAQRLAPPDVLLGRAIEQEVGRRGRARRLTRRLCRSMVVSRLDAGFAERVTNDLLDREFVQRSISEVLKTQFKSAGLADAPSLEVTRTGALDPVPWTV